MQWACHLAPKAERGMENPDEIILWQFGFVKLNMTILMTWIAMACLLAISWRLRRGITSDASPGPVQNLLEVIVKAIADQIEEVSQHRPQRYMPFIGTLFLYIAMCNLLTLIPWYIPPTSSLSTTAALAACVLIAVPLYGIQSSGLKAYLKNYIEPSVFMLPFNIVGELTRTLSLAIRLYGNMLSGTVVGGILLALVPFFVPIVMQVFGILTGMIQAYIFSLLAMVFIASADQVQSSRRDDQPS